MSSCEKCFKREGHKIFCIYYETTEKEIEEYFLTKKKFIEATEKYRRKTQEKCKALKAQIFDEIHEELFEYHHKREFSKKIHEELLPVAWHPDRVYGWCFDEEEKSCLKKLWKS